MCGPSSQEKSLQAQSQSFSNVLNSNYQTLFGDQMGVLNGINKSLSPTLAAGPSQMGFNPQLTAALNTQAINTAGQLPVTCVNRRPILERARAEVEPAA